LRAARPAGYDARRLSSLRRVLVLYDTDHDAELIAAGDAGAVQVSAQAGDAGAVQVSAQAGDFYGPGDALALYHERP
jgi:hypothetical protein